MCLQWFACCFAQWFSWALFGCCDTTFLVSEPTTVLVFFCVQNTSNGSYPPYHVIYIQLQHFVILSWCQNHILAWWFQMQDLLVTKKVTTQPNSAHEICCAKQYKNHCKKYQQQLQQPSPIEFDCNWDIWSLHITSLIHSLLAHYQRYKGIIISRWRSSIRYGRKHKLL